MPAIVALPAAKKKGPFSRAPGVTRDDSGTAYVSFVLIRIP